MIATGAADNRICIFEINKNDLIDEKNQNLSYNTLVQQNMAHSNDINCVEFSPIDNYLLASCADDGLIKIWRIN